MLSHGMQLLHLQSLLSVSSNGTVYILSLVLYSFGPQGRVNYTLLLTLPNFALFPLVVYILHTGDVQLYGPWHFFVCRLAGDRP